MYYIVYYCMEIVRVTRRYQVAIPPSVRRKLHIKAEDRLKVRVEGGRIVLEPLFKRDIVEDMLSIFDRPVDVDAVKLVGESWDED